jgi:ribonuclease P protein component
MKSFSRAPTRRRAPPPKPGNRRDETHLPALQPRAQGPPRLPCTHGHQRRPQGPQCPACPRPQGAVRLTRPASSVPGDHSTPGSASRGPAGTTRLCRPRAIVDRADFLSAARGLRQHTPAFLLQARCRAPGEAPQGYRLGITCSRKVGNAVARNRARRRLREVARLVLPQAGRDGWDYVLVGRAGLTAAHPFAALQDDLRRALSRLHGTAPTHDSGSDQAPPSPGPEP